MKSLYLCIIPKIIYGCQTWTPTLIKDIVNRMEVSQRKMEKKMLGIKQTDRPNSTIRDKAKLDDILKVMTKIKWKWAGYVACMKDNR